MRASHLCRGAWHYENLIKIPLIYSASYFNWVGLELRLVGLSPQQPPRGDGTALVLKMFLGLQQRFPTWGTCTPRGTFAYPKGTFENSNRREICIYTSFISKYLYIHQWILFSKTVICIFLNIPMINHEKYFVVRNFRGTYSSVEVLKGYMLVFQNAEGVHAYLWKCWRGTWSKKGWEPLVYRILMAEVSPFIYQMLKVRSGFV